MSPDYVHRTMTHLNNRRLRAEQQDSAWKPSWKIRAPVLALAGPAGLLSGSTPHGYGWTGLTIAALACLSYIGVFYYSKASSLRRFWLTLSVLALIHIPIIVGVRPYAEQFGFVPLLLFGSIDCVLIAWFFRRFACSWREIAITGQSLPIFIQWV